MQNNTFPPSPPRRPRPIWPIWLVWGLLLLPGVIALVVLGLAKDTATAAADAQRDAVGRSVVLTGRLVDVETNPGLPQSSSVYEVELPDGGGTTRVAGDEHWGFPPSDDYPSELSFVIVLDDPPRATQHGPVGSIREISAETAQSADVAQTVAVVLWIMGIVVYWVFVLGLPALAISHHIRRRRARRQPMSQPTAWPPAPSTPPPPPAR